MSATGPELLPAMGTSTRRKVLRVFDRFQFTHSCPHCGTRVPRSLVIDMADEAIAEVGWPSHVKEDQQ